MATLNFPLNPVDGQIYPSTPVVGENIYYWDASYQTWRLSGTATGVLAGEYGTAAAVPQFTVDYAGRITFVKDVNLQVASTTQAGVVKLTADTISNDPTTALTASAGYYLQSQIGDINLLSPSAPNLVSAINSIAAGGGGGTSSEYLTLDNISGFFNGVNTTFTLRYQGNPYTPSPQTNLMVFVGGVVQLPKPTGSYTVTGSSISFDSPPPTGASFYATTVVLTP